jgi:hypothetical protein
VGKAAKDVLTRLETREYDSTFPWFHFENVLQMLTHRTMFSTQRKTARSMVAAAKDVLARLETRLGYLDLSLVSL